MVVEMLKQDILIGGYDTGNNKLKVSFLDGTQNIQSFAIPTVIAKAPQTKVDLKSSKQENKEDIEFLHVRINSGSLNNKDNNQAWYVGSYAKDNVGKIEPMVNEQGKTEDKLSQNNKKLHLIPLFTGMAVAALRSGKTKVTVPFSGGVPIEDFKTRGEAQILDMMFGTHEIHFLDGNYEGQTVTVVINDGTINVEGVHSVLALQFDVVNGEIKEIPEMTDVIGDNFAINDLGAGTTDKALFENGILNKEVSTNNDIGTNKYIDAVMSAIREHSAFDDVRKYLKETDSPYKTREEFVHNLIAPEVLKLIQADKKKGETYEPRFITKWGPVKNVDVTEIVVNGMLQYAEDQEQDLMSFWLRTSTDKMILVGGGVLFGYIGLRELKNKHEGFVFPSNIEESSYFTSRSYLIANYLEQMMKYEAVESK